MQIVFVKFIRDYFESCIQQTARREFIYSYGRRFTNFLQPHFQNEASTFDGKRACGRFLLFMDERAVRYKGLEMACVSTVVIRT